MEEAGKNQIVGRLKRSLEGLEVNQPNTLLLKMEIFEVEKLSNWYQLTQRKCSH